MGIGNVLAELYVKITADTKGAVDGLNNIGKAISETEKKYKGLDVLGGKLQKLGTIAMATGAAIGAALWKMTDSYTKAGEAIGDMAIRTGFGVESLSELKYVADLANISLEGIETSTKKMALQIDAAVNGNEDAIKSFKKLGLNLEDIKNMKPEQQFWTIARALSDLGSGYEQTALAQDFFGRAGTNLLPMLAQGSAALDLQRQKAHDLNVIYTEEGVKSCSAYQDAQDNLKTALTGLKNTIGKEVMPQIGDFLVSLTKAVDHITLWAEAHPKLANELLKFGAAFIATGAIMLGLAAFLKTLRFIITGLTLMQALSNPLALIAGLAAAGLAIGGIQKLFGEEAWWEKVPDWVKYIVPFAGPPSPGFASGGIVPGAYGTPTPIMAHGGEIVSGLHGEFMGGTTIINVGNFMGDETSMKQFAKKVKEIIGQDTRRTSFSGINRLGYYPGSSSV